MTRIHYEGEVKPQTRRQYLPYVQAPNDFHPAVHQHPPSIIKDRTQYENRQKARTGMSHTRQQKSPVNMETWLLSRDMKIKPRTGCRLTPTKLTEALNLCSSQNTCGLPCWQVHRVRTRKTTWPWPVRATTDPAGGPGEPSSRFAPNQLFSLCAAPHWKGGS